MVYYQLVLFFLFNHFLVFILADPLEDYVKQPDPHYHYELLKTYNFADHDFYIINMTSQKWQDGIN